MSRAIQRAFALITEENGLEGDLSISHKKRALAIEVKPANRKRPNEGNVKEEGDTALPLSSLSGGERSKTLVALLLAMWEYVKPPFRCLDEWDVYLDEVGRAKVEKMLYTATTSNGYQHIFISPQQTTLEGVNVLVVGRGHN